MLPVKVMVAVRMSRKEPIEVRHTPSVVSQLSPDRVSQLAEVEQRLLNWLSATGSIIGASVSAKLVLDCGIGPDLRDGQDRAVDHPVLVLQVDDLRRMAAGADCAEVERQHLAGVGRRRGPDKQFGEALVLGVDLDQNPRRIGVADHLERFVTRPGRSVATVGHPQRELFGRVQRDVDRAVRIGRELTRGAEEVDAADLKRRGPDAAQGDRSVGGHADARAAEVELVRLVATVRRADLHPSAADAAVGRVAPASAATTAQIPPTQLWPVGQGVLLSQEIGPVVASG